jgi:hypothetical protein
VLLFNQLAQDRNEVVRVEFVRPPQVANDSWPTVLDLTGKPVISQLELNDQLLCEGCAHPAPVFANALHFSAYVPAFGFTTYRLSFSFNASKYNAQAAQDASVSATTRPGGVLTPTPGSYTAFPEVRQGVHVPRFISNGILNISLSDDAMMSSITSVKNGATIQARQWYHEYLDGLGGAYCLVEQGPARASPPPFQVVSAVGPIFSELTYTAMSGRGLQQRMRLVRDGEHVEVVHSVGTLAEGRELISRLDTDLDSEAVLHTDDSGWID